MELQGRLHEMMSRWKAIRTKRIPKGLQDFEFKSTQKEEDTNVRNREGSFNQELEDQRNRYWQKERLKKRRRRKRKFGPGIEIISQKRQD
uniref:Uncharacterized protein n=1 Tax=Tanacetum cinerariifolium TaxID=118510 RepID=A0A6L2MCD5_TANCI|nr:hypothetical protein [Tanacetum cinerariifolium]